MSDKIISLDDLIENRIEIDFPNDIITVLFDVQGLSAPLENRIFKCEKLIFEHISNPEYNFKFDNCSFDCEVEFIGCTLNEISFKNTKSIISLNINGYYNKFELKCLKFYYDKGYTIDEPKPKLSTNFYISNLIISDNLLIQNIEHIQGKFEFIGNEVGGKGIDAITFNNSNFYNAYFSGNNFKDKTTFENTSFKYNFQYLKSSKTVYQHTKFYNNTFSKVSFSNSNFIGKCSFDKCDFLSTTWFEKCKNLTNSKLGFVACEFKKYVLFDNSKINSFEISHSFFERKVSFDSFEANKMKLHQVSFEKVAYFDDLNKSNEKVLENWDRKTLRAIKRELTNSHNQIDYLRFKAYELNAFKKEVDQNKLNWKDSMILYFNEDSNYFGLDWTKGLQFIIKWSFLFYILHLLTYIFQEKCFYLIPKQEDFYINYIKFINPFSFLKPPIEKTENYFFPFSFFILGKIFVSYGIYQTVQAFRKFGVNGG